VAAVRAWRGDPFPASTRRSGDFRALRVAHAAALTAGALQEVFVSSLVIACVFAFELWAASARAREKLRRFMRMSVAAVSSTCIGLVSIVPYLKARSLGDIFTAAGADRATQGLGYDGLTTLLVPTPTVSGRTCTAGECRDVVHRLLHGRDSVHCSQRRRVPRRQDRGFSAPVVWCVAVVADRAAQGAARRSSTS
jgi:hypothetical protein